MKKYSYQARNSEDKIVRGIVEAHNLRGVRETLADNGLVPIEVLPQKNIALTRLVSSKELAIFCRQLSLILNSDITILHGLDMMNEQVEDRLLHKVLLEVVDNMKRGETFSDSMSEQYGRLPRYLINMIQIGETSGALDVVMAQMATYYEKENRTMRKVRTATTYPVILSIMMIIVLGILMVRVLPMFSTILSGMGATLPALTRGLMSASSWLAVWIVPIVLAIAIVVIVISVWGKTPGGRLFVGRMQLRMPIFKRLYARIYTSRFGRSLGLLLKSGVNLLTALQLMEQLLGNSYLERRIGEMSAKIERGSSLYEPLAALKVFPPLLLRMIKVGEETGKLDDMLFSSANIFEEEVDEAIDRMTTMIEPLLIIVLSVIVGFVLLSVMLPMTNIMSSIG